MHNLPDKIKIIFCSMLIFVNIADFNASVSLKVNVHLSTDETAAVRFQSGQRGTTVDYPVVQASSSSPDFYLTHDANGERSTWGAPFIHSGCKEGVDSPLVIVFGHNMSDGTMFAPLANYSRRSFAQEHRTILVRTEGGTRRLEVFAADVLDADSEGVVAGFDGIDGLRSFIDDKLRSCEVVLSEPKDLKQAWCFVTCSYQTDNSRTAVYAMEVRQ